MGVKDNLNNFKINIDNNIKLVAVSKTKPVSEIILAYEAGHKIFGENSLHTVKLIKR